MLIAMWMILFIFWDEINLFGYCGSLGWELLNLWGKKSLFSQNLLSWYRSSNFHWFRNIIFFLENNTDEKISVNPEKHHLTCHFKSSLDSSKTSKSFNLGSLTKQIIVYSFTPYLQNQWNELSYQTYHTYSHEKKHYNTWTTKATDVIEKRVYDPITTEILVTIFNDKYLDNAVFFLTN